VWIDWFQVEGHCKTIDLEVSTLARPGRKPEGPLSVLFLHSVFTIFVPCACLSAFFSTTHPEIHVTGLFS
jgi:hypothetical protein